MKITDDGQRVDLAALLQQLVRDVQRGDNEVEYSLTGAGGVKTLTLVISPKDEELEEVEIPEQKATVVQPAAAPKPKAPAPTPPPKPKAAAPVAAAKPAAATPAAPEAKTGS